MVKQVIGRVEKVKIKNKEVMAKIDTGAYRSSIDSKLAEELKLGPVIKKIKVNSSHGTSTRPVVEAEIIIAGKKIKTDFSIIPRKHLKYKILIGRKTIKGFLVDTQKND